MEEFKNMGKFKEKREMVQIEEAGIWGVKSVKIPTFRAKAYIMTKDEHKLYRCLEEIYKNTDIRISVQVALNQIIEANTRRYYKDYITTKIQGISIDYVLFDIKNNKTICCIELNGSEHEIDPQRIERDKFLQETFDFLKLPLIVIKSRSSYIQNEIKEIIEQEIKCQENI